MKININIFQESNKYINMIKRKTGLQAVYLI